MPKFQTKILITLESDNVLNEKWLHRRFNEWKSKVHPGTFHVREVSFDPLWEEVVKDES